MWYQDYFVGDGSPGHQGSTQKSCLLYGHFPGSTISVQMGATYGQQHVFVGESPYIVIITPLWSVDRKPSIGQMSFAQRRFDTMSLRATSFTTTCPCDTGFSVLKGST